MEVVDVPENQQAPTVTPAWLDRHPREWPPEVRTAYLILARGAERRLQAEAVAALAQPVEKAA
jgi:hypothetical protein